MLAGLVLASLGFRFRRRIGVDTGDGAGRGPDLAFGRLYLAEWVRHMNGGSRRADAPARPLRGGCDAMTLTRQMMFWVADARGVRRACSGCCSEILLPFVAGMALAYLLDPLANRLERIGINRAGRGAGRASALVIVVLVVVLDSDRRRSSARSSAPSSRSCRAMWRGCRRWSPIRTAWLRKIFGERLADAEQVGRQPGEAGRRAGSRHSSRRCGRAGRRCSRSSRCSS